VSDYNPIERLAIEQAVYNVIGADLKTGVPDNLRSEVNGFYLDMYERTGATGFEVRVNGQKVGTYGFAKVKGKPERTVQEFQVTDMQALRCWDDDAFHEYVAKFFDQHLAELAIQYAQETGELPDGVELVEVTTPAVPDGIRPNGTLRVKPERVAAALGNALPATIAGLLEGGGQ
jgi:hypothetical protein